MKTYTEPEVQKLINTIAGTIQGFREWLKNETDVIDKTTKEILPDAEINIRENTKSLIDDYVYPRLKEYGIEFE